MGKTYIAININEVEKAHSSSGGCFYPIAASVIQAGGLEWLWMKNLGLRMNAHGH